MVGLMIGCVVLAVLPLLLILGSLIIRGAGSLSVAFFTRPPVPAGETGGGVVHAIVGTLMIVGAASLIGIPLGIGAGIFAAEWPASLLARVTRFVADVLNGTPSIVVGVFAWAVYVVWGKPYAERYGAVSFTGLSLVFGTVLYLPVGLAESRAAHLAALSPVGWAAVAYLVVITSVVSYVIFYWAVARTEASRVAIWSNLQPVLTAGLAWIFYGERLTVPFLAGGAMVIAGVVLTERG